MKKLFYVIAIAAFVACNNSAEGETEKDSIQAIDSAADAVKDSLETTSDSLKNVVDSTAAAAKDSLKK